MEMKDNNGEILEILVNEDFGTKSGNNSRWVKGLDHDSLVIDKQRGIFYWNAKDLVGDALVYLTKVRGMGFDDARSYLKTFDYVGTHVWSVRKDGKETVVFPKLVDVFFDLGRNAENRDYLYRRGIADQTIDRYQLGWYNGWTMVPFFMDGTFRNFQMRRDKPEKVFKKYYAGVGPLIYNVDVLKLSDVVYITEGPVDALALLQQGIPAISTDMSGNILPEWYQYFLNQNTIYIILDNDEAGTVEASRMANVLGTTRCKIYNFWDFEDKKGYDPVDFFRDGGTKYEFLELCNTKSKYVYELEGLKKKGKKRWN